MKDNDAPLLLDVSRLVWRRWTGVRATGIDRICNAWLDHYADRAQAVIVHRRGQSILPMRTSQALFRLLRLPEGTGRDRARFQIRLAGLVLRRTLDLRDRLPGKGRLWLNPGHTGLDAKGLAAWCARRDVRPVYLVHDLIPITHPELCRDGEDQRHRRRMLTVLETAHGVVANSAHTLESLADFASVQGRAMPAAMASWPGTPELPLAPQAAGMEASFVVLGTIEGRKNHELLLSIWQDLLESPDAHVAEIPRLVIVGRRGWQADDVFACLDGYDFKGRVLERGALDDEQLAHILRGARALLFPSRAEGYGIPMAEALAAGVPVIASDLPVFHEIGQGVPELLALSDNASWRSAILEYARPDSLRRAAQMQRMGNFTVPRWRDHFAELDAFLQSLQE